VTFQFTPIESKRLVDVVGEKLEERILDGTLADGDKLPSEEKLADQFGVGRRSVREALKVLEVKGLVEVQMGVGAFVKRNDLDSFVQALARNVRSYLLINRADAEHVAGFRFLLEGAALERLVAEPDGERLQRLEQAVREQRKAIAADDPHSYQRWHLRFHYEIVDALDNPVISMLHRQVMALIRRPMEVAGSHIEVTTRTIPEHRQMIDAIRRGAIEELLDLLHNHLQRFLVDLDLPETVPLDGPGFVG
jgi:GntR family transcriptional repressor for pyruvate dehydrogenase complex